MQAAVFPVLQLVVFGAIAAMTALPAVRRKGAVLLGLTAAAALVAAAVDASTARTLEITHRFTAYVDLAIRQKEFPIETRLDIPGYWWGLLCATFCAGWAVWAHRVGERPARSFGAPLALAWSGAALQLLLEKAAAPAGLLQPFDLAPDRAILPATLAGALLLARRGRRPVHLFLYLSLLVAVTRLPLAVIGTLATRRGWGTHLDVHDTRFFVPPMGGSSIGALEVEPGDTAQLLWMIWTPHLVLFPFIYLMSTGGIAFLKLMWERQREADARAPAG